MEGGNVFLFVCLFVFPIKSLMKSLHLLVKKHNYQYVILASLILVALHYINCIVLT